MLEAEMEVSMRYPKYEKGQLIVDNKQNSYSPKTIKRPIDRLHSTLLISCSFEKVFIGMLKYVTYKYNASTATLLKSNSTKTS